jgi:hypothetical protein
VKGLNNAHLQNIGANWPILGPNQPFPASIGSKTTHADYVNANDANGLKSYTYVVR